LFDELPMGRGMLEPDERQYNQTTSGADFGRINRNSTNRSNFQRFIQLGFRLTL
jgi:hypothetical protein